jgi:hypothetical protein
MADTNKLATFLDSHKLNTQRLLAVSHKLETLQRADRGLKLAQRQGKKAAAKSGEAAKKDGAKPRSGRPVSARALATALEGKAISGPTKHRIVRAVNVMLTQKKKEAIDLRALF